MSKVTDTSSPHLTVQKSHCQEVKQSSLLFSENLYTGHKSETGYRMDIPFFHYKAENSFLKDTEFEQSPP